MRRAGLLVLALVAALGVAVLAQEGPFPGDPGDQPLIQPSSSDPDGCMLVHGDHIFVLLGGTLYKVDPEKMEVVKELRLVGFKVFEKDSDK